MAEKTDNPLLDAAALSAGIQAQLESSADDYKVMNNIRDWVNAHCPDFDFYLEDAWNEAVEGETHFEYRLRSLDTYDESRVWGYDVYLNHQDQGGVWHLDDYQYTVRQVDTPDEIVAFILKNRDR